MKDRDSRKAADPPPRRKPGAGSGGNVTVDRAFELLLLFSEDRPVITASQAAAELGITRSTAYRYLDSLSSYGFLAGDADGGGFRLGPRIAELARVARKGLGLSEVARPLMRELAERVHETILLTQRFDDRIVAVEREEEPDSRIRVAYERGHVLPLHAGSSAKVLLAFTAEKVVDELLGAADLTRFTRNTVTSPTRLKAEFKAIRRQGYAISDSEVDEGVIGVSAPLFAPDGSILAGLSAVGLAFRLTEDRLPEVIADVRQTAAAIADAYAGLGS